MGQKNSQGCTERPNATAKENILTALDLGLGIAIPDLLRFSTQFPLKPYRSPVHKELG